MLSTTHLVHHARRSPYCLPAIYVCARRLLSIRALAVCVLASVARCRRVSLLPRLMLLVYFSGHSASGSSTFLLLPVFDCLFNGLNDKIPSNHVCSGTEIA
jgi:hypothetical protein